MVASLSSRAVIAQSAEDSRVRSANPVLLDSLSEGAERSVTFAALQRTHPIALPLRVIGNLSASRRHRRLARSVGVRGSLSRLRRAPLRRDCVECSAQRGARRDAKEIPRKVPHISQDPHRPVVSCAMVAAARIRARPAVSFPSMGLVTRTGCRA